MDYITYEKNGQEVRVPADEFLTGEKFQWCRKHTRGGRLAEMYYRADYHSYARRTMNCASWLEFYETKSGERQLKAANFCHLRLCPMCTARRAMRASYKLSKVLDLMEVEYQGVKFLFLTLTIKNVLGADLGSAISILISAWKRFIDQRQIERSFKGWFRAIEITRNGKMYHPHIHAIIAVEADYFSKESRESGKYINQSELIERWQNALQVDYRPSVRIQTAKAKGEYSAGKAAAIEAAKYAIKDVDYIDPDLPKDEAVQVVRDYTEALKRKRLTAFGGWMKEIAIKLDAENLDDGDLVHVEDERIRPDLADFITVYNWNLGVGNYVLAKREINPLRLKKDDE